MVVHGGKTSNPIEVILTAQSLSCKYRDAFNVHDSNGCQLRKKSKPLKSIGVAWELIIKIAGARKRRPKRTAYAYEAKNFLGIVMFFGSDSCGAPTPTAATKEALVQVAVKAKNLGFCRILFFCCSNKLVEVYNQNCNPSWEDKTLLHDLVNLQH